MAVIPTSKPAAEARRRLGIGRIGVGHGLDDDGGAAADDDVADLHRSGGAAVADGGIAHGD